MEETAKAIPAILDGTFYEIISQKNDKITARCITCKSSEKTNLKTTGIINGSIQATSNFVTHLKRKHADVLAQYEQYIQDPETKAKRQRQSLLPFPVEKIPRSSVIKNKVERLILDYIVHSMAPLKTVDDPYFIELVKGLDRDATVMSQETLRARINGEFDKMKKCLRNELEKQDWVCSTADVWSSASRSYLGMTVHWIDNDLRRVSSVLCLKRFTGTHSNDKIAEIIQETFCEYGISKKVVAVITDNGSNFVKAFEDYGLSIDDFNNNFGESSVNETLDEDIANLLEIEELDLSLPPHVRCASHTLSLVATKDIEKECIVEKAPNYKKTMRSAFGKCTALWNKISRSNRLAESTNALLGKQIKTPVATRWNSVFDSVTRLLEFESKLEEIFSLADLPKLKDSETDFLSEYLIAMKSVASAIDTLQSEKEYFFGYLAPTITNLMNTLNGLSNTNEGESKTFSSTIALHLMKGIRQRFSAILNLDFDVAKAEILSACTMPVFRIRWIPEESRELIKKKIIEEICKFGEQNDKQHEPELKTEKSEQMEVSKWDKMFGTPDSSFSDSRMSYELEAVKYLNDKDQSLKALDNYPTVKKMFLRYNVILPSSAPAERLFSYGGMVLRPKRSRLSDDLFEKLVMLKLHLDRIKPNESLVK